MKNLVEDARTCHGEHTTHGKFIQRLADRIEELEELYEAACKDAKEAEAYIEDMYHLDEDYRVKELETKLAAAIEALDWVKYGGGPKGESAHMKACETLDALKGEKDE